MKIVSLRLPIVEGEPSIRKSRLKFDRNGKPLRMILISKSVLLRDARSLQPQEGNWKLKSKVSLLNLLGDLLCKLKAQRYWSKFYRRFSRPSNRLVSLLTRMTQKKKTSNGRQKWNYEFFCLRFRRTSPCHKHSFRCRANNSAEKDFFLFFQ